MRRLVAVAGVAGLAALVAMAGGPPAAAGPAGGRAAEMHHAGLIIDPGTGLVIRCVGFSEDSITGKQLLQRAEGVDPVFADFSGNGSAVCALCGTGCPPGNCLTCDPKHYWAYNRAPAGTTSFRYSQVGAGATTVRDGDVDGWKWGSGAAPPFRSFASICAASLPPPTTAPPATTAVPSAPTTARPATSRSSSSVGPTTSGATALPSSPTSAATAEPTGTSADASSTTSAGQDEAAAPAARRVSTSKGGGSSAAGSALGFAAAVTLLAAAAVGVRRRKRRSPAPE